MNRLLAACSAVLVLTACTADPGPPDEPAAVSSAGADETGEAAGDEPPPPPRVGQCYRLTLDEATRPTSEEEPVPCTRAHTARTFHVGRLDTVVGGRTVGADSQRVQRQLARTCPAELEEFLGGDPETRALSRFEAIWFSPSPEEYAAGADWFRCDVVALAGPERLLELPREQRLRGVLHRPEALATYGLCGTAEPGAKDFERVACASPHSWVAIGTIPISGGDRYPGVEEVREAGDESCSDEVGTRNETALEYRYGWEWPTADQWAAGQRYGFCWAPER